MPVLINAGNTASSDIVATANNGSETVNYGNLGINSSGYSSGGITGGANNAYLYSTGNDFIIGNSTNSKSLIFYTTAGSTSTERMRITNAGLIPGQDNAYSLGNSTNRWTAAWAVNGTIQTSDARLKKNIRPLSYGLDEIMRLNPVSYNWIDISSPGNKIGLIAQEVKKVIPEVVIGDEQKEKLGMNYAEMVPVLINAIKELNKEVNDLEELIKKSVKNK
jgi:Chaperone of endosialidase